MKRTIEERRQARAFDAFFESLLAKLKPHILADEQGNLKPPAVPEYVYEPLIEFVSWI